MTDVVYRSADAANAVERQYRHVLAQWPVPKTEQHVPTRQGSTFVLTCGPEDAPPVVLLHGAQANSAVWMFDAALWSTRYRLLAVDMIGEAGLSARIRPELNGENHAQWLDDVFAGLGITRAALIGTSLGGWLALDYACRRPSAVSALALMCPAGIGRQKNFLLRAMPLLLFGSLGKRKVRELVFGPSPKAPPEDARPLVALMELIARTIKPRMLRIPRKTDTQLRDLRMPILAIIGGRDVLLDSRDTCERLRRTAPQAEICFIEDGYHFLPNQASRIMAFLDRSGL